jgi:hypothetical protein
MFLLPLASMRFLILSMSILAMARKSSKSPIVPIIFIFVDLWRLNVFLESLERVKFFCILSVNQNFFYMENQTDTTLADTHVLTDIKHSNANCSCVVCCTKPWAQQGKPTLQRQIFLDPTSIYKKPILHEAVRQCEPSLVDLLIARGADVNAKCSCARGSTMTPLLYGITSTASIVRSLCRAGADIFAEDNYGHNIMHELACITSTADTEQYKIICVLCSYGASVLINKPSKVKLTPRQIKPLLFQELDEKYGRC